MRAFKFALALIVFALLAAFPAFAEDEHHEGGGGDEDSTAMPYTAPEGYAGPAFFYACTFVLCNDYANTRKWYEDTFGLSLFQDYGEMNVAVYTTPAGGSLVLGDAKSMGSPLGKYRESALILEFIVQDNQAAYDWAVSKGATGYMPPSDMGGVVTVSAIGDPEGNQIWLVTPAELAAMAEHHCACGDNCAAMCGGDCHCPEMAASGTGDCKCGNGCACGGNPCTCAGAQSSDDDEEEGEHEAHG